MNEITVTGMVLSVQPIGEFDRRLVMLTRERGRISVFARGARKPNSVFVGTTSPFTFGEFELYEGRSSYTLRRVKVENYFEDLKNDMDGVYYGMYFLDLVSYFTREAIDESQPLLLLYQTLRALSNHHISDHLIRRIFELKLITLNGEGPQVFKCQSCGSEKLEGECYFSTPRGGVICGKCYSMQEPLLGVSQSTLYTLQYIVSAPVVRLYSFVVSPDVQKELDQIVSSYMDYYVDKKFKSSQILEAITK